VSQFVNTIQHPNDSERSISKQLDCWCRNADRRPLQRSTGRRRCRPALAGRGRGRSSARPGWPAPSAARRPVAELAARHCLAPPIQLERAPPAVPIGGARPAKSSHLDQHGLLAAMQRVEDARALQTSHRARMKPCSVQSGQASKCTSWRSSRSQVYRLSNSSNVRTTDGSISNSLDYAGRAAPGRSRRAACRRHRAGPLRFPPGPTCLF